MSWLVAAGPFFVPTLDPDLATPAEVGLAVIAVIFLVWVSLSSVLPARDRHLASKASNLVGYVFALLILTIALERATAWIR
ncbi:MAG: hypothetical protein HKN91_04650 [Acidimicrobiia bacterium]|nr:hypothetical protein [Acidimicrobiia bacterium]